MDKWVDKFAREIRNVIFQPDSITIKITKSKIGGKLHIRFNFFLDFSHSHFKIISVHQILQSERGREGIT